MNQNKNAPSLEDREQTKQNNNTVNLSDSASPTDNQQEPTLPEPSDNSAVKLAQEALTKLAERVCKGEIKAEGIEVDGALKDISAATKLSLKSLRITFKEQIGPLNAIKMSELVTELKDIYTLEEIEAAKVLSLEQNIFNIHRRDLKSLGYCGNDSLCDTALTASVARLLPKSSAYIGYGVSGSGKSELFDQEEKLLPPEYIFSFTSLSEQALNYVGVLKHKILKLGELPPKRHNEKDDTPQWSYLRQLLSGNKLEHGVVEEAENGKRKELVKHTTEGPCVVWATTTRSPQDFVDEVVNRASWLPSDEREATTVAVLQEQSNRAKSPWLYNEEKERKITRKWQAFHANLKPLLVAIPFAKHIKPSVKHVTARRLYPMILNHIKASALVHQANRKYCLVDTGNNLSSCHTQPNGSNEVEPTPSEDRSQSVNFSLKEEAITKNVTEYLIANIADYENIYHQINANAPKVLELVTPAALDKFKEVRGTLEDRKLTIGDFITLLKESEATVRRWIRQYENASLLVRCEEKRNKAVLYELGIADPENIEGMALGIVTPEELKKKIEDDPHYTENLTGNASNPTAEPSSLSQANDREWQHDRQDLNLVSDLSTCHHLSNITDRIEPALDTTSQENVNFSPEVGDILAKAKLFNGEVLQ